MWKMVTPRLLAALIIASTICVLITMVLYAATTAGINAYISILRNEEKFKFDKARAQARKDYENNMRELEETYESNPQKDSKWEEWYKDQKNAEEEKVRDVEVEFSNKETELEFLQRKLILLAYSFIGMFVLLNVIELLLNLDKEILTNRGWSYYSTKLPDISD